MHGFRFGPKTCRPAVDEVPRRTRKNTSGTQGRGCYYSAGALRDDTKNGCVVGKGTV